MSATQYDKHIVTDLRAPMGPERAAKYATWATRILWMDEKVVDGAFQMNCSWYRGPSPDDSPERFSHTHDSDEIIGFFGDNWQKPYDLGAEIEFWLEDEKHIITSSAMIFVPAGMRHCPLILRRVERPIFHYSVLSGGQSKYIKSEKQPY
jgi:hypothetical protein